MINIIKDITATALATVAGTFVLVGSADALTLTRTASFAPSTTDIEEEPLSIEKFNSALGILRSVTVDFMGSMLGDAGFENRSSRVSTVIVNLGGELTLDMPTGTSLFSLNPQQSYSYNVARYDGSTDYIGASGRTLQGLTASISDSRTFTDSSTLSVFTGLGSLNFLFSALATSTVAGSGNISSYINTYASAGIRVIYDYDLRPVDIPEGSTTLSLGMLLGLGALSQIRKSAKAHS